MNQAFSLKQDSLLASVDIGGGQDLSVISIAQCNGDCISVLDTESFCAPPMSEQDIEELCVELLSSAVADRGLQGARKLLAAKSFRP